MPLKFLLVEMAFLWHVYCATWHPRVFGHQQK